MRKPFNMNNPDKEIDNIKSLNHEIYDYNHLETMMQYAEKAETLHTQLEMNEQEIRQSFTTIDWLHVFANSITEYGMDMHATMRLNTNASKGQSSTEEA